MEMRGPSPKELTQEVLPNVKDHSERVITEEFVSRCSNHLEAVSCIMLQKEVKVEVEFSKHLRFLYSHKFHSRAIEASF